MEQGSIIIAVENYILDNGKKTRKVVMANILVYMVIDILDNGQIIINMVMERFSMEIIQFIPVTKIYNCKVNFKTIKKMVQVTSTALLQRS